MEASGKPDVVSLTYSPASAVESAEPRVAAAISARDIVLDEIRELRKLVESAAAQPQPRNIVIQTRRRFSSVSAKDIYAELIDCGFDDEFAGNCLDEALSQKSLGSGKADTLKNRILAGISARISTDAGLFPQAAKGQPQIIALVGPTGVGKTTTIAKLAARAALDFRLKVALVTNDTYRIAAAEQLRTYAEIIGIPLHVANGTQEMTQAIGTFSDRDVILIDTAGRSQRELDYQKEWSQYFSKAGEVKKALVLSATTKADDLDSAESRFQSFDPDWIIFTKLDDTEVHGPMIRTLIRSTKPLAYVTTGQDVPQDIAQPGASQLAQLAMGRGEQNIWEEFLRDSRPAGIVAKTEEYVRELQAGR